MQVAHRLLRPSFKELAAWMALGEAEALPLAKRAIKAGAPEQGAWLSHYRGQGMVFDEVRHYQSGDEVRHIDWRVTARTGKPHIKLFQEEHQQQVVMLVDDGPSMQFGTRGTFKNVQAARMAAMIGGAALGQKERVGGSVFRLQNGQAEWGWLKPSSQRRSLLKMMRLLSEHPAALSQQYAAQWPELLHFWAVSPALRSIRSILYIVSDFAGYQEQQEEAFQRAVAELSKRHRVTMVMVADPADKEVAVAGMVSLHHAQGAVVMDSEHEKLRHVYKAWNERRVQSLMRAVQRGGAAWSEIATMDKAKEFKRHMRGL